MWVCVSVPETHTHTHKRIHTVSHVPPCWHPHWYHTLSTLSWLCFSQSLQAKDNFNYWWAAEQWKWGLHWLRRATIDFAHYVHENVSILCRSACPPPAAGDKEPVHCACLICVTEVVCAKIDVAFRSTVCGPCWGLLLPVCLSLLSPGRQELCAMGSQDLHQYRCWLCMLVFSCFCFCLFFMSKWEIEGLSTDIIKYLDVQELHITHLCRWFQNTATLKTFFENWIFWLYPVILNHIHSSIASDISRDCNFKSNCHNADCFQSLKHNLDDQFFKKHCNFLQWHLFRELVRKQIIKVLFPWRCAISIFTF